ncbi:DUF6090 family protein [Croceivirga thetidis]|uniref:Uncharacterized protein n=1 Tax=Croceivirga thetidis TaxID=2721623 RepID=A0ABX1GMT7_9FLAO|nr:DUF6090 family protein [Croceivirga thetidis]NKI30944.1 hypothetical protein [Croceivirga thetidis]
MIKFFRRIRQKLLSENKFSKYLLYAIGEIVLVVIGILIALQINNWNENKKTEVSFDQFVIEFKQELQYNIQDLKVAIAELEHQMEIKKKLLTNNSLDTLPLDSLEAQIESKYINVGYNPTILRRFENAQIGAYGQYDSIFIKLQNFYGYHWPEFEKAKQWHNNQVDIEDEWWRYGQNSYELNLATEENLLLNDSTNRKKELLKLLHSPKVRNMLKSDYSRKKRLKPYFEYHLEMANEPLELINSQIK